MNPGRLQPWGLWAARAAMSVASPVSAGLIAACGLAAWHLYTSNWDTPPTWYLALTLALIAVDVASICFILSRWVRVLRGKRPHWGLLVAGALLAGVLWISHQGVKIVYLNIPQWDFADGLFGDLTRPGPGRISSDCTPTPTAQVLTTESGAPAPRPISYGQALELARIHDWLTRKAELERSVVAGWKGWVQDVSAHYGGDNPDRQLVALFLHDPYAQASPGGAQPEAELYYLTPADAGRLSVGQEVFFCGRLSGYSVDVGTGTVTISEPIINPRPLPNAIVSTQVPGDFLLNYEVYGCREGYVCPEYKVSIDASGRLTYLGIQNVLEMQPRTAQLTEFKLKELVYELRRAGFLAIEDLPGRIEGRPAGSIVIEVRMEGIHKTVVLPWNTKHSEKVLMIEGKIKEVGDFTRWVQR